MYIKFAKVRKVKTPTRANPGDAGLDLYIPEDFPAQTLSHGESVSIPAGVKFEVPFGYALIAHNKSGVAVKKNLYVGASVIDHGYAGEVHVNVINNGLDMQRLSPGDKIIQLLFMPVLTPVLEEIQEVNLYQNIHVSGARGEGGFGSTGTR